MTADNRTVHTDALATLGTVLTDEEGRDAIHLGVVPVNAITTVYPGQHVNKFGQPVGGELVGIVDPFLKGPVYPGQKFWLVIYPRVITSLRHVWTHPEFDGPEKALTPPMPAAPKTSEEIVEILRQRVAAVKANAHQEVLAGVTDERTKSLLWIENYATGIGLHDGHELIEAASDYIDHGDYLVKGGDLEGVYLDQEFWDHYEKVMSTEVPEDDRGSFFSCSC